MDSNADKRGIPSHHRFGGHGANRHRAVRGLLDGGFADLDRQRLARRRRRSYLVTHAAPGGEPHKPR
jgi:hypothetical protein